MCARWSVFSPLTSSLGKIHATVFWGKTVTFTNFPLSARKFPMLGTRHLLAVN